MPFDAPILPNPGRIRLAELFTALSHALDLTEGQPPGHCVRVCWIGMQIGRMLGLSTDELADLHYALLLKDLGCSSNAARICQLYLTDDRAFKADSKRLGDELPELLGFVLRHTGPHAPLAQRIRATWTILRGGGRIVQDLIQTRCERGADIARQMRFSERVAAAIASLDERWDGKGRPLGLAGLDIPLLSRIALLSQVIDVFHVEAGRHAAIRAVEDRSGTWFDPDLAALFQSLAGQPRFWSMLSSDEIERAVLEEEPAQRVIGADDDYLDDIAAAFARVIDAKSPFTAGHSARVAGFTAALAAEIGLPPGQCQRLRRAALLHDIGKLGISNTILDKPGQLDEAEWRSMRRHSLCSRLILARVPAFGEMAEIGGNHHEKLDGSGYPAGLRGEAIGLPTRIVSIADVCDALTAKRPYRDAMEPPKALAIMAREVGTAFDPACFAALEALAARSDFAKLTGLTPGAAGIDLCGLAPGSCPPWIPGPGVEKSV